MASIFVKLSTKNVQKNSSNKNIQLYEINEKPIAIHTHIYTASR